MNSFETDVKRAIISKGFLAGFVLELVILWKVGGDSELFHGLPIIRAGISRRICQGAEEHPISVASSSHVGLQADWLRCFHACYICALPRTPQH